MFSFQLFCFERGVGPEADLGKAGRRILRLFQHRSQNIDILSETGGLEFAELAVKAELVIDSGDLGHRMGVIVGFVDFDIIFALLVADFIG